MAEAGERDQRLLDVCCVGDLCVDLILSGDVAPRFHQEEQLVADYTLEIGGSATIFASQFVKLGGRAGLVGAVGNDPFGARVRERLEELGIEHDRVRQRTDIKTGIGVALARPDGDRAILTYPGSIDAVEASELDEALLSSCRHWHIASYFLLDKLRGHWQGWLERCQEAGMSSSLDPNWDPSGRWDGVMDLLPRIDVFLPNEAEALAITRDRDVYAAGRRLADRGPLVVIKRGREGAMVFVPGITEVVSDGQEPAPGDPPSGAPVDTIGAGDNFDAGFVRGWLLRRPTGGCLHLACRCARASLSTAGGIEGQLREAVTGK
jgi:sugar/nucleoside kinase (ribokinase family)